jgi:hypothetical protein
MSSEPRSSAERTALTVFHDLQLAYVRKKDCARKTGRGSDENAGGIPVSRRTSRDPRPVTHVQGPEFDGGRE